MKKRGYSSLVSSSTTKSGTSLIISETVFWTQLFPKLVLMGHFALLMPIFANPYPKVHEEESPIRSKAQKPIRGKAQRKARPKDPPRRPKSKKSPKKKMQGKAICSRMQICNIIQICRRMQFFSIMASANQGKLGSRPF